MNRSLLIIFLAVIALTANCQTPVPGGNVSGCWTPSGSPYDIQGSIMIPADSTLIIQAGVTISFQGHYKFLVLGRLLALGTEVSNILFTADSPTTGWYGLRFNNTSSANDSSIIDYCTIQYGRATDPEPWGGGIEFHNFSKARVSHCLLTNNYAAISGGGIDIDNCSPVISYNTFKSNLSDFAAATLCGGGGLSLFQSNSLIIGNVFTSNTVYSSEGGGGAIFISGGTTLITGNTISFNTSINNAFYGDGGGGGIFSDANAIISNNTISNNSCSGYVSRGGGIFFYWNNSGTLVNNTITNNSANGSTACGGAIYCYLNCNPVITNNTIVNNYSEADGGALYCYSSSNPVFRNCIFYGNKSAGNDNQVFLYDEDSDPDFYNCDINGGVSAFGMNGNFYTGKYQDNIDGAPLFGWPSQGCGIAYDGTYSDWTLRGTSPCINAGDPTGTYPLTDKGGNPRVIDGCIDIGAYEFLYALTIQTQSVQTKVTLTPNPFSDHAMFQFNRNLESGRLEIYDPSGKKVSIIVGISGGKVMIDRGTLRTGVYFYKLLGDDSPLASGKFVIAEN